MKVVPKVAVVFATMNRSATALASVRASMDLAFAEGADAVWILDDDSWPRADALAAMLE